MQPELSLIFCSRAEKLPESLLQNIDSTIGCEYELVVIDNSQQSYSIYEAYQLGYERSSGIYLAYLHDDVYFHTPNWGLLLKSHLDIPGAGIMGIGGRDTLVRVPSSWTVSLPYIHLIQSDKNGKKRKVKHRPVGFTGSRAKVSMLDGVMLCMPRRVMETIAFDTRMKGFHGYDFDICIRASAAGFQNYVMYNIDIEHFSRGSADQTYYKNLIQVFEKNTMDLPVSTTNLSETEQHVLEIQGMNRLARKMMVKGFTFGEILTVRRRFCEITGISSQITPFNKALLGIQFLLIRFIYKPCLGFKTHKKNG